jgi:hypothetical protein
MSDKCNQSPAQPPADPARADIFPDDDRDRFLQEHGRSRSRRKSEEASDRAAYLDRVL